MAKTMTGIVASNKGDKTIVVRVTTRKTHPLYKKQYTHSTKFMAHDEKNEAGIGDTVIISETRPLSARKRFTLDKIVEKAAIRHEEEVPEIVQPKEKTAVKTEPTPTKEAPEKEEEK
jgi:small subunit ribosomal protein S17